MTEKFPTPLPPRVNKQRVFGIDLARFVLDDGDERAVVVTSERDQITVFSSRADGSWQSIARPHDNLDLRPRRPDDTAQLGWTRRIGVGIVRDQLALAYKRRFDGSDRADLWIELYVFNRAADGFRRMAPPVRFPREGFDIDAFGWSLWADFSDGQLHVVAQALSADRKRLVLLQTQLPVSDSAALANADRWTLTDLHHGGWDFDARREGPRLVVLDRPVAAAYAVDLALPADLAFSPITVELSENAAFGHPLAQMATSGMALIEIDLPSRTVTSVDQTLPFGESPMVHSLDPFVASIDRLATGSVVVGANALRVRRFHAQRHLVMRTSRGWRATRLFERRINWPRSLARFARVHTAVALQRSAARAARLSWSALWTLRPIALFTTEQTDKGRLLTFGHQDPQLGALTATTFRVFEDDGGDTLKANAEGFTLLDIGHRHIAAPPEDNEPVEHEQLRPHAIEEREVHADGPTVVRLEDPGNTMNGFLAAHRDNPATFYSYTEMGDGGVRVVHESTLEPPPPAVPSDDKTFRPEWVAELPLPGRAWVRLTTPEFVDTRLPAYFNPPTAMNAASLVCNQQSALDGLAVACDQLRGGVPLSPDEPLTFPLPVAGDGRVRYREPPPTLGGGHIESIALTAASARDVQRFVVEQSEQAPLQPVGSANDQPFAIEIHQPRSLRFANDTLTFEGVVVGALNQDEFQFDWSFSDGTTASGRLVEHDFDPTLPDFSRINPGRVRDDIEVTLTVTAPDDRFSVVSTHFELPRSLWATLWTGYSAFRRAPDDAIDENGDWQISEEEWERFLAPGMFVRDVTVSFYRYSIRYQVDEDGRGTRVEISNRTVHDGRYRFRGNDGGQGDVEYEVPLHVAMSSVQLTGSFGGGLGSLVAINSVDARLRLRQRFTIGVQTSEQRTRRAGSETMIERVLLQPTAMVPSALCCLPVGEPELELEPDTPAVDASLTAAGWTLSVLVPAVIAAAGTAAVVAILLPLLLVIAPGIVAAAGVSLMVSLIVGAGLGALAALLIQLFVLGPLIQSKIREALEEPSVRASFGESGLFDYAGEGLAESLARHLIQQAQADGHAVADPEDNGRDRFRSPFFDTIVIGEGQCKALLRV